MTYGNAHAASAGNQPTPDRSSGTSSNQREREGGHDSRKQAADADCEGESREVSELSLEDGLVPELGSELGICLVDLLEVENLSLSASACDLDKANASLAVSHFGERRRRGTIGVEEVRHGALFKPLCFGLFCFKKSCVPGKVELCLK